jgi:hypothetical protein
MKRLGWLIAGVATEGIQPYGALELLVLLLQMLSFSVSLAGVAVPLHDHDLHQIRMHSITQFTYL